jgi:hypothetical protein
LSSGWLLIAGVAACTFGCAGPQPAEPALQSTATIKDIMDAMVDPSADFLFDSVATIADENGITEKAPRTDEEWAEVRRHAIQLVEAPTLLIMKGRRVAAPGESSKNPEIELQPDQIQARIDADRQRFIEGARILQDAALTALEASQARSKDALFKAAERIDKACENCHLYYWYPNDKRAQEAYRNSR